MFNLMSFKDRLFVCILTRGVRTLLHDAAVHVKNTSLRICDGKTLSKTLTVSVLMAVNEQETLRREKSESH